MRPFFVYAATESLLSLTFTERLCAAFYLREVVMSNQNEGEFLGVIFTNGDLSLEERVATLEKQLTDIQAAMSCDEFSIKEGEIFIEKKAIGEPLLSQLIS